MQANDGNRTMLRPLTLAAAVVVLGVAGLCVWWLFGNRRDESAAKRRLIELGALVAMDADGRHVGTVTLSTVHDLSKIREALQIVATLRQVKAIDLNRAAIDNEDLRAIGGCSSLVSLSLKSTQIDDDGLRTIAGLGRLESLHLNDTAISDAGLPQLARLTELKLLDLSGTAVAVDLSPLCRLEHLEWLVLGKLTLEDGALKPLESAPALRRLTLRDSTYSDSALRALQNARPTLTIDR